MKAILNSKLFAVLTLCIGLLPTNAAQATVTTLIFDEFTNGTPLITQYQSLGVTATDVTLLNAFATPWPAQSGINIAVALNVLMTFNLDSSITGDIQSVSAYFAGQQGSGIFAYDASDTLLGQSVLSTSIFNAPMLLLSVSSLNTPITKIRILGGAANYAIDNLSFSTASVAAVPEPETDSMLIVGLGLIGFMQRRRKQKTI